MAERQTTAVAESTRSKTEQEVLQEQILDTLAKLAGRRIADDSIAQEGTRIVLPETMTPKDAIAFLRSYIEQQETETSFTRNYKYRPWDGAHALQLALKRVFGTSGIAKPTWSFFGKRPPQLHTIATGVKDTAQVPWGQIEVPAFSGSIYVGSNSDPELGPLFSLEVEAPRKYRAHVEGLFDIVQEELELHSIYRHKAIDGQSNPEFIDLSGVDPNQVIYSDDAVSQLEANIWSVIEHTSVLRELGIPRKRAVLLEGPYGTGKTLGAYLTAQRCMANDWTFIYCRPGRDNLSHVMGTARLYQPSVVFFEDVDKLGNDGDDAISRLLDLFDGINAKGTEIMVVLTTNHKERIHRGMVRPGRLDAMIHIGALDRHGVERMIRATVPQHLLGDVDYGRVFEAMSEFLPAFVREATDRAMRYAISRTDGNPTTLETADFVSSARGMRPQLELMREANEGSERDPLEVVVQRVVEQAVNDAVLVDVDHGEQPVLKVKVGNGSNQ